YYYRTWGECPRCLPPDKGGRGRWPVRWRACPWPSWAATAGNWSWCGRWRQAAHGYELWGCRRRRAPTWSRPRRSWKRWPGCGPSWRPWPARTRAVPSWRRWSPGRSCGSMRRSCERWARVYRSSSVPCSRQWPGRLGRTGCGWWSSPQLVVDPGAQWRDPVLAARRMVYADPAGLCRALVTAVQASAAPDTAGWLDLWQALNRATRERIAEQVEGL